VATFAASDGLALAYRIDDCTDPWRPPATLILLHAAMGSMRRYYAWVPRLMRHYRVVRLDLRGHGASALPPADQALTLERLVDDVAELMDHLECPAAHLVGNSAGGYLAQQLAMTRPARVRSLMLFASTPGLKHGNATRWLPEIAAKGLRQFLAETIHDRFPTDADPARIAWFLDEAAKNDVGFITTFVGLMARQDWADELGRIACPTLVVIPGAEPIGSTAHYEPFRRHVRDVELTVYDGAPHNIGEAFPERCADTVLDFLGRRFGLGA
jgi:pimeloyl-ACP methyl ester carboxylesterase